MGSLSLSPKMLTIRADADTRMGTGHLMRCLALTQAWQTEGGHAVFLSHCESDALRRCITDAGKDFIPIAQSHPAPQDLQTTLQFLAELGQAKIRNQKPALRSPLGEEGSKIKNGTWLVLDGYHFDPAYQQAIQSAGFRLMVIDDTAHLPAYHADIIFNQNLGAEKLKYNCDPDTTLLLGPRYALLRPEFLDWRGWRREIPEVARKVLVTMGGSDPDNVTLKVIQALQGINIPDLEVKVVVGPSNPHIQELQSVTSPRPAGASGPLSADGAIQNQKSRINIIHHSPNIPELMAWADLAMTAGGSTCWESAFMGLPALVLILADNQTPIAAELERQGMALNLGWHTLLESGDIAYQLRSVIMSSEKRGSMSNCGRQLVDGGGAMRVIRQLRGCKLALRPVRAEDCRLIWEWANDPVARAQSFLTEKIPWKKHLVWFESKRTDPSIHFYIAVNKNNIPAGQIRYQINGQAAVVSISLAPEQRGRGYGAEIIRMGTKKIWATTKANIIHAYIKQDNIASVRAFAKAGFISAGMEEIHGQPALHYVLRR